MVAVAVTIPDLSAGAMDSPYFRIDVREPSVLLDQPIWSPAVGAMAPVYRSAMAAETIAPASLTFSSQSRAGREQQSMPLGFLEGGSKRFDLAFAGVAMPTPVSFTISRGLPTQSPEDIASMTSALRVRLIDVPQITNATNFTPPQDRVVRRERSNLQAGSSVGRSVAVANEAIAAAFAGTLDVSGGVSGSVREALSVSARSSTGPATSSGVDRTARAIPLSSPVPDVSASSAAAEAELVAKTHLDARINGVMTGRVDFQQLNGTIAVRLGSVVDLLRDRYSASELDRISGASAMGSFVTLAQLQAAGIPISYDPVYDEIEFGIDYDDAPQAAKVQIEQIGVQSMGQDRVLMNQIPR